MFCKRYHEKGRLTLVCFRLLYSKDQDKVFETKFCAKEKCIKNIKGNLHNPSYMQESMEVHQNDSNCFISGEEGTAFIRRFHYSRTCYLKCYDIVYTV